MADDRYLAAQKRWAAKRLDVATTAIKSIEFEVVEGFTYGTGTYSEGYFCAKVTLVNRNVIEIEDEPTTIIRECMEEMQNG